MAYKKRDVGKVVIPIWAKQARRKMIDRDMTQKELAAQIGIGYTEVSAAMRGLRHSKRVEAAVINYFKL